jgi:pimeloyl-ACP methyl ester carboxylesterase
MKERHSTKSLQKKEITSSVFQSDSFHIKYWIGGQGPTLVFIHGFGGNALISWEEELAHFAKTNTVVAYDLLWFGESYSNKIANLTTQTNALYSLLSYLKIDQATLVGQSYGGFVALNFAHSHPEMIEKLFIANSPGSTFDVSYLDSVCKVYNTNSIDELFVIVEPAGIQRLINLTTYSDKQIPNFLLKQMFAAYFDQNHEQMKSLMQSLPVDQNRIRDVSSIQKIPTLVLWGENDELFPKKEGEKFAKAIDAQFISIPECGHAPQIDDHESFLKILDNFILDNHQ